MAAIVRDALLGRRIRSELVLAFADAVGDELEADLAAVGREANREHALAAHHRHVGARAGVPAHEIGLVVLRRARVAPRGVRGARHRRRGGRLGRRLTLRVSDIMRHGEEGRPVVAPTATFQEVLCEITGKHLGATGVADNHGSLAGIITEYDFRSTIQKHGKESFALTAESMMNSRPALVLRPDQMAFEAMQAMRDRPHTLSIAPVIDAQECYIGMIHITDLVHAGL